MIPLSLCQVGFRVFLPHQVFELKVAAVPVCPDLSDALSVGQVLCKGETGRVYGGQKINGHSLHYFNPPHRFLKLYKITK
ncbi:hypothetical protein E2C01_040640 [Portunus trituberculatus]|uniref:Uncharacterized protein n=1 Tax=Portunus trituberculatus TaxID=210409 RepID=A0A5B7FPR6_PORTR|nr:hypothetical protein [Portunus trituberculatus]